MAESRSVFIDLSLLRTFVVLYLFTLFLSFRGPFAKMSFFYLAFALLGAVSPAAAAQVSILQVSSVVSSATSSFAPAVNYAGPTGSASSALKTSSMSMVTPKIAAATQSATPPYWLETIAHHGISAFNSAPASYQVFRNVKSFGAKGKSSVLSKELESN